MFLFQALKIYKSCSLSVGEFVFKMLVTGLSHDLISYAWRTTEWAECRVDVLLSQQDRRRSNQTGLCGGGMQTREVYCIRADAANPISDLSTSQDKPGTKHNTNTWWWQFHQDGQRLFIENAHSHEFFIPISRRLHLSLSASLLSLSLWLHLHTPSCLSHLFPFFSSSLIFFSPLPVHRHLSAHAHARVDTSLKRRCEWKCCSRDCS